MKMLEKAEQFKKRLDDWNEKIQSIPFISFDPEWEVKVVPAFIQGIALFKIRHKSNAEKTISILLDPNSIILDQPAFWEIDLRGVEKCDEGNLIRIPMAETEELLKTLRELLS